MSGRIAVTGAAGFLGRALLARLPGPVRATDLATLDVRRPIPPEAFAGCDVVVHLAARTGVSPSLRQADAYHRTNATGTGNVVRAAQAAGVRRLVLVSSSSVYGECDRPASESRATAPLSPYGESKVGAEAIVRSASSGLERVILRPFTVYGPGQRPDMLIARLLAGGEGLRLFPFVRDFTFVDEVVAAIAAATSAPVDPGEVLVANLGSGRPVSAGKLLDALEEVTGRRPQVAWGDGRPGEPARTWADPTVARHRLGLPAPVSLVEGLGRQRAALVGA